MSKRNIAKFSAFVIFIAAAAASLSGCSHLWPDGGAVRSADAAQSPYSQPRMTGKIQSPDITESSGLAASKCQPGVLWTHNDSGDDAFIYAIDTAGKNLGTWRVSGAENRDWEDIAEFKDASGQCWIYIGEIGNNGGKRDRTLVYRVKEPAVNASTAGRGRNDPLLTEPSENIRIDYPGTRENAEALMVHPKTGEIYIVSKRVDGPAAVYRIEPQFGSYETAVRVAEITVPSVPNGLLTGGDIAPDGSRLVLCDYAAGYELTLPAGDKNFDDIWKQTPVRFDIGERKTGESIAYSPDGTAVYAGSEGRNSPILEMKRK